jgi:hypothetical protein
VGLCRWGQAKEALADEVDELLEVAEAGSGALFVQVADEVLDLAFMVGDEGFDVVGVEELGALGLGQDEVGEGD